MTDQTSAPPPPSPILSEQQKTSIISGVSSALMVLFMIPGVAALFPPGTLQTLQADVPIAVGALSTLAGIGVFIYKLWPKSPAAKIALAEEIPQVSRVVTTDAIANSPQFASNPTVVSHSQAMLTPPPAPVTPK